MPRAAEAPALGHARRARARDIRRTHAARERQSSSRHSICRGADAAANIEPRLQLGRLVEQAEQRALPVEIAGRRTHIVDAQHAAVREAAAALPAAARDPTESKPPALACAAHVACSRCVLPQPRAPHNQSGSRPALCSAASTSMFGPGTKFSNTAAARRPTPSASCFTSVSTRRRAAARAALSPP